MFCNAYILINKYANNWTSDSPERTGSGCVYTMHTHTQTHTRTHTQYFGQVRVGARWKQKLTNNDNGSSHRFLHHGT